MHTVDTEFHFDMYSESGEGIVISPRFHTVEYELCEILSGSAAVRIGTRKIDAAPGEVLFVPKGTSFSVRSVDGPVALRGVIFDSYLIESDMVSFDTEVLYLFSVFAENRSTAFAVGTPEQESIHKALDALYEEYLSKDVCFRLPLRAWLLLLMTGLLRSFCTMKNEQDRIAYHNVLRLRPVINYISDNLGEKIYIEKLSDMIGVSPDYFTKMFKESIGKTPIDYMNALRVKRSIQLLIATDTPVADVAEQVGFSGASYFHKTFKQYMDVSPTAYRKEIRGAESGDGTDF